ncbi:unnamed protein product, partial [Lampetra planeri]
EMVDEEMVSGPCSDVAATCDIMQELMRQSGQSLRVVTHLLLKTSGDVETTRAILLAHRDLMLRSCGELRMTECCCLGARSLGSGCRENTERSRRSGGYSEHN